MMRSKLVVAIAAVLAVILSGLPAPAGAGGTGGRTADNDNNMATATAMNPGAYNGDLSQTDDVADFYSAQTAVTGSIFNVSVEVTSWPVGRVKLTAYDPGGKVIEESNFGLRNESVSVIMVQLSTNYYFAITVVSGGTATYTIHYGSDTATPIAPTGNGQGWLDRAGAGSALWYSFTMSAGMNMGTTSDLARFTITHDACVTLNVKITTVWFFVLELPYAYSFNISSGGSIAAAAVFSGTYYLRVQVSGGSGSYTLSMGAMQSTPCDGLNETDWQFTPRINNTPVASSVDEALDHFDIYQLYLLTGEMLDIKLTLSDYVRGSYGLFLVSHTPGDHLEAYTNNYAIGIGWTNTAELIFTPIAANHYYIVVTAENGLDPGGNLTADNARANYTLKLLQPDPANHAPVVMNQPPNQIPEDSANYPWCQLYPPGVFDEVDGEGMHFSVNNSTNIKLRLDLSPPSVYITTTPNWSGTEKITITATDASGLSTVLEVYLTVYQVSDGPVVLKKIENQTVEEDSGLTLNLSEYFYDADVPYGDTLTYQWSMAPAGPIIPMFIDNGTGEMTIGPVKNINNQAGFLTTRQVNLRLRDHGDPVHYINTQFLLILNHVNHRPALSGLGYALYITMMEDEVNSSVNIKPYFADNDTIYAGDALRYRAIGSEHINCTILPDGRLEVKPAKDWYGEEIVYVTATDLFNETATLEVTVTVLPVDDLLEIVSWWPVPFEWRINETETLNLTVEVTDIDTNSSLLTYSWFVDTERQLGATGPRFMFFRDYGGSRSQPYRVTVSVNDGESTVNVTHSWDIPVQIKNRLPTINITSPVEAGIYPEGQLIRLSAKATDPEGDKLSYTWKEGNTTLGNTFSLNWKFSPGNHTATIWVDDGTGRAQASVTFFSDSVPTINITSPADRAHFKTSDTIKFSADVFDRDGDTVTLEWRDRSDKGKVLSRSANFATKLGKGGHDIALNATDGRNSVESYILIFVDETPPKNPIPGFTAISVAAAILAAAAVASLLIVRRRRRPAG